MLTRALMHKYNTVVEACLTHNTTLKTAFAYNLLNWLTIDWLIHPAQSNAIKIQMPLPPLFVLNKRRQGKDGKKRAVFCDKMSVHMLQQVATWRYWQMYLPWVNFSLHNPLHQHNSHYVNTIHKKFQDLVLCAPHHSMVQFLSKTFTTKPYSVLRRKRLQRHWKWEGVLQPAATCNVTLIPPN